MRLGRLTEISFSNGMIGLLVTVAFHLVVIIVMLCVRINSLSSMENSFVFDFSRQEEIERIASEEAFKKDVSRHLDELIRAAEAQAASEIRNVAVDATTLGEETQQLIEEGDRLLQSLQNHQYDDVVDISKDETKQTDEYRGPSVVSYTLDGRKASHLKIPAYKCLGGGDVTVTIIVDHHGNVVNVKINDPVSSTDPCLRDFAVKAAKLSKFSKSTSAPARQPGEIVYRFIPQ